MLTGYNKSKKFSRKVLHEALGELNLRSTMEDLQNGTYKEI